MFMSGSISAVGFKGGSAAEGKDGPAATRQGTAGAFLPPSTKPGALWTSPDKGLGVSKHGKKNYYKIRNINSNGIGDRDGRSEQDDQLEGQTQHRQGKRRRGDEGPAVGAL